MAGALLSAAAWASLTYESLWLQTVLGLTPIKAGLVGRSADLCLPRRVPGRVQAAGRHVLAGQQRWATGAWGMFARWPVDTLAGAGLGAEVVHQTTLRGSVVVLARTAPPTMSAHSAPLGRRCRARHNQA